MDILKLWGGYGYTFHALLEPVSYGCVERQDLLIY